MRRVTDGPLSMTLSRYGIAGLLALASAGWGAAAWAQDPIEPGQSVTGALTDSDLRDRDDGRYDAYRLTLRRGERVTVALDAEGFDAALRIGRGDGDDFEELAFNDDAPGHGLNSRLTFSAPSDGVFIVRAGGFRSSARGPYALSVEPAAPAAAALPIAVGDRVEGRLTESTGQGESGRRAVTYQFQGREGQRISVLMTSSDIDAYLELFRDRDGVRESLMTDDDSGGRLNARLNRRLSETGTYLIEARAYADDLGAYVLELTETPPEPVPTPLAYGQTLEGEIAAADPRDERSRGFDAYILSGVQGRRVQIIMRSGDFDAYLQIGEAGEDFVALAEDDDGLGEGLDSRLTFSLPADGDYVVRASALGSEGKGLYSVELIDLGPEPEPGSILIGETARGTLGETDALDAQGVSFDAYRIHAKAGDKLRITMVSNAFDAYVEVGHEGETFESLASDDDGLSDTHARLDWTVEDEGWYVIRARSYGRGEGGEYALTVERQP